MAITQILKNKLNQKRWMAYKVVFNPDDPNAREVLKDLCAAHHVFDSGFDPDPIELARMSAERNVVLRILTILRLKPEDIIELAEED